ncbi:hypothetical protein QM008_00470, partial [Bifidobacterium angulatum]|uniref:hypothetical protein n=1 Tax=Bifidobacterium angulatum TaxID=1683 RepID=UPI00406C4006
MAQVISAHLPGELLGVLPGVWRAVASSRSAAAVTAAVGRVIRVEISRARAAHSGARIDRSSLSNDPR